MDSRKIKKTLIASAFLIPCQSIAAVENLQYIGYVKWGNIYTDNDDHAEGKGKRTSVIRADEGYGNYRLGNEMNWWEVGFKADMWRQDEARFDFTWYIGNGGEWGDFGTLQVWSGGHGLIENQADAVVWVGQRFYQRKEVHMIDVKYWDVSDIGAGVEQWNLDFAKGHIAYFSPESSSDGRALHHLDLRLSDIQLAENADLTLGLNYAFLQNDEYDTAGEQTDTGAMLTAMYRQGWRSGSERFFGSNTLTLQYGVDGLAGGLMSAEGASGRKYNFGIDHSGSSWRIINAGDFNLGEDVQVLYSIAYQDRSLDNDTGEKWFSIGARPHYSWTQIHSTALEFGFESVEYQESDFGTNDVFKITLSQMMQAGKGVWARPSLRVFITYADQTQEWSRIDDEKYAAAEAVESDVDEITFGFNFEAWW